MSNDWCLIESDPGVFTELIQKIGVNGVQVCDIYSLDPEELLRHKPIYGLIFLFKWSGVKKEVIESLPYVPSGLFFARQMVTNACATQALLSILMNIENPKTKGFELGNVLSNLKDFSSELPPERIGESIGGCEPVRQAHNSFKRREPFVFHKSEAKEDDDVFHFISYVPFRGKLYELDGIRTGPVLVGDVKDDDWLETASAHIKKRISLYKMGEIKFHLMAVVHDRQELHEGQINEMKEKISNSQDEKEIEEMKKKINELEGIIGEDIEKKEKWKAENIRRRHNYLPFLTNLLKVLAEKKVLTGLVDKALEEKQMKKEAEKLEKQEK